MQLTLEEKLKYVKMHIFEHVPICEIEEKYHLDHSRLNYYIQLNVFLSEINDVEIEVLYKIKSMFYFQE